MKLLMAIITIFSSNAYSALINIHEADKISKYLNNVCMDTYCGGDYNWKNAQITCSENSCYLDISAMSWYKDELTITPDEFEKLPITKKQNGSVTLKSVERDYSNLYTEPFSTSKVNALCKLTLPKNLSVMTYSEKEDAIYFARLNCVDEITPMLREL